MNKFFISALIATIFGSSALNAQNIITLKDGGNLRAAEIQIFSTDIKFKMYDFPHEESWKIARDRVSSITYENGLKVIYDEPQVQSQQHINQQQDRNQQQQIWENNPSVAERIQQHDNQRQDSNQQLIWEYNPSVAERTQQDSNQQLILENNPSVADQTQQYGNLLQDRNQQLIWEDNLSIAERKIEYRDGITWHYYMNNDLIIALTNTTTRDYGNWHRIDIVITNSSMYPIEINPEKDITASSVDKKNLAKNLTVMSSENYLRKVRRSQTWAAIAVGVSEGLATAGAGYSTSTTNTNTNYRGSTSRSGNVSVYGRGGYVYGSYNGNSSYRGSLNTSSITTTYDATAAYQARALSQDRMANFFENQVNTRNAKQQGYLKRNTIYPGETIQGYVHIQRISGVYVYITVNINGVKYNFDWKYGK